MKAHRTLFQPSAPARFVVAGGRRWLALLALAILPLPLAAASPDDFAFVYPSGGAEWVASADLDGNGHLDAVIVDRPTGTYRIGYQAAGGHYSWTAPRASGIPEVSGFAVGNVTDDTLPGLAFTAPAANRVNLLSADSMAQAGTPVPVYIPSVGPDQVVAIEIGGVGNTPYHDLLVASTWNGPVPFRHTTVRNTDGASFTTLLDLPAPERIDRANRVHIKSGDPALVAFLQRAPAETLRVLDFGTGVAQTVLELNGLPAGSDYAVADFSGDGLSEFLVFQPGQSNLSVYPVEEPIPGQFQFAPPVLLNFSDAVSRVVPLPGPTATRLLVIFNQGSHAATYDFDGAGQPALVDQFTAPAGQDLLGALPAPDNVFQLLSGTGQRSSQSAQYHFDAGSGSYVLDQVQALPAVGQLSGQANVFQFQMEPFVAAAPRLLSSLNAADWSSGFVLGGVPPEVSVTAERYQGAASGLDNPFPAILGVKHPQTQFGLVNQYLDFISLFSLAPARGDEVVEVSAQPPGGLYATSVGVTFTLGSPGFQVFYRLDPVGAWMLSTGSPIQIITNAVLQYRAKAAFGTAQTAVKSEHYQFELGPDELDSDDDGLLDYVEVAQGLHPAESGADGDGDGYSDLQETLQDSSPTDPLDTPAAPPGYEQHAAVDFVVTPRPLDGVNDVETESLPGTLVRLFELSGSLLASAVVAGPPDVPVDASALFPDILIDAPNKVLLVATEPHFDLVTAAPDTRIGRELVGLIVAPAVSPVGVNYAFGGANGNLQDEADAWIAAAKLAYANATPPPQLSSVDFRHANVAGLLELKLNLVLGQIEPPPTTNLTLFSFRPADAGRPVLTDDLRLALQRGETNQPAYDLKQMVQTLEHLVLAAPPPEVQPLNALAHEIYRVSSALNNDAPGQYRLPLDVLRRFLHTGVLDANYLAGGDFPPALLTGAQDAVTFLLDSLGARPVTNLNLRILPGSFAGPCTTVATDDLAMAPVNLFSLDGGPFDFPDTFNLLPGSVIHVTGRPDVLSATCAGLNVEVLSIALQAVPQSSDGDADGNLLVDSWEKLFFGMLGSDPFQDTDGDGYPDVQEMFEGSDPTDGLGVPPVPMASMELPALIIATSEEGDVQLVWQWPDAYGDRVEFVVQATSDLGQPPVPLPIEPTPWGENLFTVMVPNPGLDKQFYTVALHLK